MYKEIYLILKSTKPGCLKSDVYKYAKENKLPLEPLESFTDVELLGLDMGQLFVLPKSQKTDLITEKRLAGKSRKQYNLSQISLLTQPQ